MRQLWRAAILAAVALPGFGCGSAAPPAAATVRGAVTFQGRPLAGGVIVFAPDRDRGTPGKPATARIGPDGGFRVQPDGTAAVSPGWYRVAIADAPGSLPDGDADPRFPPALRRPDRSGLDREVVAGADNVFVFHIEVGDGTSP